MRIRITEIGPKDGYWRWRNQLIGLEGEFHLIRSWRNGWQGGKVTLDKPLQLPFFTTPHKTIIFAQCKFTKLDTAPLHTMTYWDVLVEYIKIRFRSLWK